MVTFGHFGPGGFACAKRLLFTASVWSRTPGPPLVPGVFFHVFDFLKTVVNWTLKSNVVLFEKLISPRVAHAKPPGPKWPIVTVSEKS